MKTKDFASQKKIDNYLTLKFRFNYARKLGYFSTFIDLDVYPVYDGKMLFWEMPEPENIWLSKQWSKATKGVKIPSIYLDKPTEMKHNKQVTWLTNHYCPVCLRQKSYFENHHCVARSDNGQDGYKNVLKICATCHAIITRGCLEERWQMENAALFHQVMYFGLDVFPRKFRKFDYKEYEKTNIRNARFEAFLKVYDNKDTGEKEKFSIFTLGMGRYFYQFYRDVIRGVWHWKKAVRLFPNIYSQLKELRYMRL